LKYDKLTDEQQEAILESHIEQVESQHVSATIQVERERVAGRDTAPAENLVRTLELEHAALLKQRRAKK
jgi:hypothetical protein